MKLTKLSSSKLVPINIRDYMVNWEGKTRSKFQTEVKQWLKQYWKYDFVLEELRIPGSRMTCDLVNISKLIIVEISGEQHHKYIPFFHGPAAKMALADQISRDLQKQAWAEMNGFTFTEVFESDLPISKEWFKEKYDVDI